MEGPVPDGAGGGDGQDGPDHAAVNDLLLHGDLSLAHLVQLGVLKCPGDDSERVGLDIAGEGHLPALAHTEDHRGGGEEGAAGQRGQRHQSDETAGQSGRSGAGEAGQ